MYNKKLKKELPSEDHTCEEEITIHELCEILEELSAIDSYTKITIQI